MKKTTAVFDEVRRYVAGIDLAGAADHYVCGPRNDDGSHDIEHFGTTTPELLRMLAWLNERRVESVVMESTSVYWVPVWDVLEVGGLEVRLVDTREVRMVPGRKSDVKDCQWLQRLHSCGLLRGCFRPPEKYNAIRSVLRERRNIVSAKTQTIQTIQKSCDQMNIRIHHAVSDIDGVTGMRILDAIVHGERDPRRLAALRDCRCRKTEAEITEELTGNWREEHLFTLEQAYRHLVFLNGMLEAFDSRVKEMFAALAGESDRPEPPTPSKRKPGADAKAQADLARLAGFDMTGIDGISFGTAAGILSELGNDLSMFPTENHFVSYIGLAPPLAKSAGKNVRTKRRHRNTHPVGQMLKNAASTLYRSKSALGALYRSTRSRSCTAFAVMATARQMAKFIYRGMKYGEKYVDIGERQYEERRRERTLKSMKSKIQKLSISAEELGFLELAG
jgi:transposase